jgi:DNA polymerase III delta' subunit
MSFKDIVGQDKAVRFLRQALRAGRLSPALLFAGPPGVGKRRAARELAKALNCASLQEGEPCDSCVSCRKIEEKNHPDVIELDFAKQAEWLDEKAERQTAIKIELVRMIDRHAGLKASEGAFRVVIFDPAQDLTEEAANALLKLLEEPPPRFQIILIVEDETALLSTIRSRCALVRFDRMTPEEIARHLQAQGNLSLEDARTIAGRSGGSLGQAQWEKEWAGWEAPVLEELELPEAFQWMDQFGLRQGGRSAAQTLVNILIQKECDQLSRGALASQERLRALLTASAALKQNVTPRLALEALYLRFRRIRRSPGSLRLAPAVFGEDD